LARVARRFLEQRAVTPPLRPPQQGHRRDPGLRYRLPRCPDAHPV